MPQVFQVIFRRPVPLLPSVLVANALTALACLSWTVPPALSLQRGRLVVNFVICSLPLLWALTVIVIGRCRAARLVGIMGLVPGVLWLAYAVPLVIEAFRANPA